MSDRIRLTQLQTSCLIGILPEERVKPQTLLVDIELTLDVTRAALSGELAASVDYASLAGEVAFILEAGQFRLLETAALGLCRYLLANDEKGAAPNATARVTLTKPEALRGVAIPAVEVSRPATSLSLTRETENGGGEVVRIFESSDAGIYRLEHCPVDTAVRPRSGPVWRAGQEKLLSPGVRLVVMRR